ncbi:argininosuccinate lyase [Adlercreutzia sp. R7]|uniref:Argininosuccinate lyase n=1 Tax=Adlercreutzia wanghongyangiae TaxID=3111451 RepID=A0ABU6IG18_9ACTN|nr:argininosuccinate lyase [Adlercreutzia sp. R7]
MPALQVRDFPATLYDQLKEYAARNHRSIAQQTIIAVEEMLAAAELPVFSGSAQGRDNFGASGSREVFPRRLEEPWPFRRTVSEERVQRRQRVFADFDEIDWKGAPSTAEDIVAFVNEGRDERTERILSSVDSPDFDE